MYSTYQQFQCPYLINMQRHNSDNLNNYCRHQCPYCGNTQMHQTNTWYEPEDQMKDYGPEPYVVNIAEATKENDNFRTTLWTGEHLQLTLMSINPQEDIGLEIHPDVDQFLRVEEGQGIVRMGKRKDMMTFQERVYDDFAILIPAGTWHNIINTGEEPLKLYSIYAPPQHPKGTVHMTKEDAEKSHG
jgi:mannose-6-phosphate isomerase-like protein (cupin superfamily)